MLIESARNKFNVKSSRNESGANITSVKDDRAGNRKTKKQKSTLSSDYGIDPI